VLTGAGILGKVREKVEAGWCKYDFYDRTGRMCLGAACREVRLETNQRAMDLLYPALLEVTGDANTTIIGYNDRVDVTKDDVIALIDLAIKLAGGDMQNATG